MSKLAVCVSTYRRPQGLGRLLAAVAECELADVDVAGADLLETEIVVVDNDPSGSAAAVVDVARASLPCPVRYIVEPRRGIAQSRNAAVRAALPDADFLAFFDDDQIPDRRCVVELVRAQRKAGADIVMGPVLPCFELPPPAWVREGRFFEQRAHRDMERLPWGRTGNVLVSAAALSFPQPPFNEALGLAGGEDSYFFRQAYLRGYSIIWAERAVAREMIPPSKCRVGWVLRRAYRRGNTRSLCLVALEPSMSRRVKRAGLALVEAAKGLAVATTAVVHGKSAAVSGLARLSFASGLLTGMSGRPYLEYRASVHGH